MNRSISLLLLVAGVILIAYGISASDSLASRVSRFFTNSPTDKTIWLLLVGIVAALVGLMGVCRRPNSL